MNNKRKLNTPITVSVKKLKTMELNEKELSILGELTKVRDLAFSSLKEARQQINNLKKERSEVEKKALGVLKGAQDKINQLENDLKESKEISQKRLQQCDEYKKQLEEQERMIEEERFRANQFEDRLEIREGEVEELNEKLKTPPFNTNYKEIQEELNALQKKCKTHKSASDLNKLVVENENLKKSVEKISKFKIEFENLKSIVSKQFRPIDEYNELVTRNETLRKENLNLNSTLKRKEGEYNLCNEEMKDIEMMIEEQTEKQKKDQATIERLTEDNKKIDSLAHYLGEEVKVLKFQNEKLQKNETDLLAKAKLDRDENINLDQELERLANFNSRLKLDNADLRGQIKLLQEDAFRAKQIVDELETKESENTELRNKIKIQEDVVMRMTLSKTESCAETTSLKAAKEHLEKMNEGLEEQKDQYIKVLEGLRKSSEKNQELIANLQIDLESKTKEFNNICEEYENIKIQLDVSNELVANLKFDLNCQVKLLASEKTNELKSKLSESKALVTSLNLDMINKEREISEKISEMEIEMENLKQKYESDVDQINARLKKKKSQVKTLEHKNYEKKQKLKRCQRGYEEKIKELTDKYKTCIAVLKQAQERRQKKKGHEEEKAADKTLDYSEICNTLEDTLSRNTLPETETSKALVNDAQRVDTEEPLLASSEEEDHGRDASLSEREVCNQADDLLPKKVTGEILYEVMIKDKIESEQVVKCLLDEILCHKDFDRQEIFRQVSGIKNEFVDSTLKLVDNSANSEVASPSVPDYEQYQHFIFAVADTVRRCLRHYYNNEAPRPIGQYRIVDENEFTELCRDFSRKFREELRSSHINFTGHLAGILLTSDNRRYIRDQIDFQLDIRKQNKMHDSYVYH